MFPQQLHIHRTTFFSAFALPIFGYLLWRLYCYNEETTSKNHKKKIKHSVPGLVNSGNTCFMNSLLQCIVSQPSFTKWLEYISRVYHMKGQLMLAETLSSLMQVLSDTKGQSYIDSTYLLKDLMSRGWHISYEEHDSHEFFHCIMTTLEEELCLNSSDTFFSLISKLLQELSFKENSISEISRYKPKTTDSVGETLTKHTTHHPFHGMMSIRLCCSVCGNKNPVTFESFDSLSLPIDVFSQRSLLDCLKGFFACEVLNAVECSSCTTKKSNILQRNGLQNVAAKQNQDTKNSSGDSYSLHTTLTASKLANKISSLAFNLPRKQSCLSLPRMQRETASFYKFSHISKFPQCLCIHLQRLVWKHGQPMKLPHHIAFPEVLDLGQFMSNYQNIKQTKPFMPAMSPIISSLLMNRPSINAKLQTNFVAKFSEHNGSRNGKLAGKYGLRKVITKSCLYQLTGVIVHIGNWNINGHFIAYRRHVLKDDDGNVSIQWFYTSDVTVKKVSIETVLQNPAYMLFYERTF